VCIKCTAGSLPEDERTPQHLQFEIPAFLRKRRTRGK